MVGSTGSVIIKSIRAALAGLDRKDLTRWAADCAEHVLSYFESGNPGDDRPRRAIDAGRAWARGEIAVSAARKAAFTAHAAAREAVNSSASAAARAAGHAAATAHVAGHAIHAAVYAAKAVAFALGEPAAEEERRWQLERLTGMGEGEGSA